MLAPTVLGAMLDAIESRDGTQRGAQAELARLLGVHHPQLSRWLDGEGASMRSVSRWLDAWEEAGGSVSVDYRLGGWRCFVNAPP